MKQTKLAEVFLDYLKCQNYTHCFFLAGGNIMHLLDGVRNRFVAVPFVHEVSATIAAEYFNVISESRNKAFVLVTAGPGITNLITGLAGAWLESREVLVLAGQVKTTDLSRGLVRQKGIQEVNGLALVESITKIAHQIDGEESLLDFVEKFESRSGRPGPVFVEWCLDAQGMPASNSNILDSIKGQPSSSGSRIPKISEEGFASFLKLIEKSSRPILLIGSGLSRAKFRKSISFFEELGIPMQFTWNAADYLADDHPLSFGRPNTWGQLSANLIIQQSDLVIAVGSRLSLQQTGFAWEQFAPLANVIQIDIDKNELDKGTPRIHLKIHSDADFFVNYLVLHKTQMRLAEVSDWLEFCKQVRDNSPSPIDQNSRARGFIQPQEFMNEIAKLAPADAAFTPSSSGGTFTVAMQVLRLRAEQRLVSNKGLASMGYGTAGAIGMALAFPDRMTICMEGDGGFAQNIQELGTVSAQSLNIKFFVFSNSGYASIRMTQRNYFDGNWIGCDEATGVGLPKLSHLAMAFGIKYVKLNATGWKREIQDLFEERGPLLVEVSVDPEQTYFPKISSKVDLTGKMISNPLHRMTPELDSEAELSLLRFLKEGKPNE